jgi:hypothetical protein
MPWIFNPSRDVQAVKMLDGSVCGFMPRKKIYVSPEKLSAEAWRLLNSGQLVNKGGDPAVKDHPRAVPHTQAIAQKTVTSSSHHRPDASFTVDSSNADLEKESKVEKKQSDETEKATSETSEVVTQGNDEQKISKRNRKARRR